MKPPEVCSIPLLQLESRLISSLSDLRAVLKLQPHNAEVEAELEAVNLARLEVKSKSQAKHPPDTGQACEASTSSPSSSRYKSAPPPNSKTLPFELTERDKRKLKITLLPLTVDLPGALSDKESFAYPSWERYVVKLL